jgi:hypothetical protein
MERDINMKYPSTQKYILHHDDPPCEEELINGYCPVCKYIPDMQSTALWPNPDYVDNESKV